MGWVNETPSGKFQGGYRDVNNKLHRKNFERKTDAKKWVRDNESAIDRGEWVNPAGPKTPCEEIIDTWLKNKVNEASTLERVASVVKNHIRPYFEGRAIGSVVRSDIQGWVKKKGETLAPATVESMYRYVSNVFSTAVKDGVIAKSPCFDIDLPTVVKPRVKPMTTEQVEALLNAMPARYRALVVLGAGAGLRQGEAFGVTVPHVSISERVLHVEQQLQVLIGKPPFLKTPKRESHRDVPLPDPVLDVLAWHMTEFPPTRLLTGIRGSEELLLFTDENGQPLRRTDFSRVWVPAREAAKLPKTITFHDLRHYYASLLIARGASVKVVQARLGHKTAQETMDTYGHLWIDDEELTREAVGNELKQALTVCRVQAGPEGSVSSE